MKKQIGACVLAGSLLAGAAFADPEMKVSAGFKLPFTAVDFTRFGKGSATCWGDPSNWEPSEDFKFDFHSDSAGVVINFKPFAGDNYAKDSEFDKKGLNVDEYSAWFNPIDNLRVSFGTSGERHWFQGVDERVNNKPGEISIIDCDDDSKTGLYYGIVGRQWKGSWKGGFDTSSISGIRAATAYGWNSSEIGGGDSKGTNLRVVYGDQQNGLFAKAALVKHNSVEKDMWSNQYAWESGDNRNYWISEVQGEVGYAWDTGSVELIYKTPKQNANVVAVYYQPRLLYGNLIGTLGFTFANDTTKGHSGNDWWGGKVSRDANEFTAFAVDARFQYNVSEKLKTYLYFNYSQINVGDDNALFGAVDGKYSGYTPNGSDYSSKVNGKSVGAEQALYAVASVGYTLPLGYVNLDAGLYMRDLDDNDEMDVGENFTTVKACWTYWFGNGAGIGLGGAWYHALNTGDMVDAGYKDNLRIGAYFEVWLNN